MEPYANATGDKGSALGTGQNSERIQRGVVKLLREEPYAASLGSHYVLFMS
jgi:hypothetical protein